MKKPSLDPKQFRHRTPLEVTTERFMLNEQRRLLKLAAMNGFKGEAAEAFIKLSPKERTNVVRAQRKLKRSMEPIIDSAKEARRIVKQRNFGHPYGSGGTSTGRFSSLGPPPHDIHRSNIPQTAFRLPPQIVIDLEVGWSEIEAKVMQHFKDLADRIQQP